MGIFFLKIVHVIPSMKTFILGENKVSNSQKVPSLHGGVVKEPE